MAKISVVIPTYNRAGYLDAAIKSVLAQSYVDFEVVISDNCSQDETESVVGKYLADSRVKYFKNQENIGMVRNWRKAIYEYAAGDWFLLLSDDDYLIDGDYLEKAIQLIERNLSVVMIYADGYLLDEVTGEQKLLALPFEGYVNGVEIFVSRGVVKPQDFTLCNVIFNRKMAIELNAFSNADNISCDSELFLKLALKGDVGVVKGPVSVYRFHSGNLLKTLSSSPRLIGGNIDFILSPYLFAKPIIPAELMSVFRKNSNIEGSVAYSLLMVACFSWPMYIEYKDKILSKAPELLELAINSKRFQLKLVYCRFAGWSYPAVFAIRQKLKKMFDFSKLKGNPEQ